jgi:hypothetical protein
VDSSKACGKRDRPISIGLQKKNTNTLVTLLSLKKNWRIFATWRQKNYNATHVNDFCLKKNQI